MNLGIAMTASLALRLPKLLLSKKELVDWCKSRNLTAPPGVFNSSRHVG